MPECDAAAVGQLGVWLKQICLALTADPPSNMFADVFTPLANIVLALAALTVAWMSWRTARRANAITTTHREQDRDEQRRRWRRTLAVDMREWESRSYFRALWGIFWEPGDEDDELRAKYNTMINQCDIEGEADGKRLLRYLYRELYDWAQRVNAADEKERAKMRHPSRMFAGSKRGAITRWADDPGTIELELKASEAAQEAANRARSEAIARAVQAARERAERDAAAS
jgi:hypothetical protein